MIHEIHVRNHALPLHHRRPRQHRDSVASRRRGTSTTDAVPLGGLTTPQAEAFLDVAKHEGLPMQIFGIGRNARDYRSWTYVDAHRDDLP